MLTQLKKTPVVAALAFVAACSVCVLPALIAAIAAGSLLSVSGGFTGSAWLLAAGVTVLVSSVATAGWLIRLHRNVG